MKNTLFVVWTILLIVCIKTSAGSPDAPVAMPKNHVRLDAWDNLVRVLKLEQQVNSKTLTLEQIKAAYRRRFNQELPEEYSQSYSNFMEANNKSTKDTGPNGVKSLLQKIEIGDPEASCPECGLGRTDLVEQARKLKTQRDEKAQRIEEISQKNSRNKAGLTEAQLAETVELQVDRLNLEVSRLKMLNRIKEIDLHACNPEGSPKPVGGID